MTQRHTERTSSGISDNSGSVTLEAALVFPFFIFALYAFIMLGQLVIADNEVQRGLTESARQIALECYGSDLEQNTDSVSDDNAVNSSEKGDADVVDSATDYLKANYYFRNAVDEDKLKVINLGVNGVLINKTYENNKVILTADFSVKLTIPLYGNYFYYLREKVSQKAFTGYDENSEFISSEYVYVAETGEVYHTNPNCRYISIKVVEAGSADTVGKGKCLLCGDEGLNGKYVTISGNKVHTNPNCSSLKRTIRLVRKDQLNGMRICSVCGADR